MKLLNIAHSALATAALAFAASPALADQSPWQVRLGAAYVNFSPKADIQVGGAAVPGAAVDASSNTTLALDVSYDLSPRWTGRLIVGVPPTTTLTGRGALEGTGTLGKVKYGPAVLSATYNLMDGPIKPYVGAGINYTIVFASKDGFIRDLEVKNAFGAVLQAGVEAPLSDGWSVGIDLRKIYVKTKADGVLPAFGGAPAHGDIRLDPLIVFASVGKRF